MIRALTLTLALLLAPSLVVAQDRLGTISATIGGDDPRDWYITADGDESQSALAKIPGVPLYDVSLWGNTAADATASLKGALLLDFSVTGSGASARVMDPTLQFLEDGYSGAYITTSESDLAVTIGQFEETGSGFAISGSFEATTEFTDNLSTQKTDPSKQRTISGTFDVTLPLQ